MEHLASQCENGRSHHTRSLDKFQGYRADRLLRETLKVHDLLSEAVIVRLENNPSLVKTVEFHASLCSEHFPSQKTLAKWVETPTQHHVATLVFVSSLRQGDSRPLDSRLTSHRP